MGGMPVNGGIEMKQSKTQWFKGPMEWIQDEIDKFIVGKKVQSISITASDGPSYLIAVVTYRD